PDRRILFLGSVRSRTLLATKPRRIFGCAVTANTRLPRVRDKLKFEIIDVYARDDQWIPEQNHVLLNELKLAKATRFHNPGFWFQRSVSLRLSDVDRPIAYVERIP